LRRRDVNNETLSSMLFYFMMAVQGVKLIQFVEYLSVQEYTGCLIYVDSISGTST